MTRSMFQRAMTRREALLLGGGGAAALLLASCGGDDGSNGGSTPTTAPGETRGPSGAFSQPETLVSSNGALDVKLRIAPAMVPYGAGTRWALTVNGTTPGPTLRVKPGDTLKILLENRIGHATNLHTHGLRVSPSGNADNPFIEIPDGEDFAYEIPIPADHPGGLFWYHPHFHHAVAEQLFAGFFGAIIVEDAFDRLPEVVNAKERLLILHDARIGATESAVVATTNQDMMMGREGTVVLVNGQEMPSLSTEAGALERWRVLNASSSRFMNLALDGHKLMVIGGDGGRPASNEEQESVKIVPGERLELLVRPTNAGQYTLTTAAVVRGRMGMGMGGGQSVTSAAADILKLSVTGAAAQPAALPQFAVWARDASLRTPDQKRELVFSMQGMNMLIDGKSFDGNRVDIRAKLGTVEEWTVRNVSTLDHPFHLHIWPFEVLETSAGKPPLGWKDVVNVPAGGQVKLSIPINDIPGKTVYHCHILDHEDMGMMGVIEVTA